MKWVTMDFETSNSDINIEKGYTRVWLWDIYDPDEKIHITGDDIEYFFDELFKMPSRILYSHNLKFDGSFIIAYLLKNGFFISSDSRATGAINTLITDRLIWYTFTVHYCGKQYKFRDSAKKINGSLEKAAQSFKLPIRKGEIDYKKHRDKGYIPTTKEKQYIHGDTEILALILQYYYDNDMTGMTNASDAMSTYKNIITKKGYNKFFPTIPKETDDFIRKSYKGGYCYLNPKHFNKELHNVYTYDVKSMYPSVMANLDLPYGIPIHYNGKYEYDSTFPLYIQQIRVDCKLKKGKIPSIQTKSFMTIKLNYLRDTNGEMRELILTKPDLERLLEDYDIYEIKYIQGYKFLASNSLFKKYVMHFYELKETSEKGAKRELYKIFLNSLYGKFAMMCERQQAYPTMDDGVMKFKRGEVEEVPPIYTAVASFITSWARKKLIDGIYANLDNFIYCDTDSMHLLTPAKDISLGKELGDFDLENGKYIDGIPKTEIYLAKYLGQKCYMLCTEKGEIKKIAGAPDKVKEEININNFEIDFTSNPSEYPKYRMKNVDGGVLLIPTSFTIKAK